MTFPVVSADSDHRLLSGNPRVALRWVHYMNALAKPHLGPNSAAATQL